jgi:hypothetical protein
MSTLPAQRHVSNWRVALALVGVIVAMLGLLWLLQGAGVVHMRPVFCVSNCKPVTKSVAWLVAGAITSVAGVVLASTSARHLHRP